MIVAVTANHIHIPPIFIFPRVYFKYHMFIGAPTASIGGANTRGWLNETPFIDYVKHFISSERPCKKEPFDFRQSQVPLVNSSHQHRKRKCDHLPYTAASYNT
jgi:hypothetical protein